MSDPVGRNSPLTGRGESASAQHAEYEPPESIVGERRAVASGEQSPYLVDLNSSAGVEQLALALAEKLRPQPVERPFFGELVEAWLEHIRPRRVAPGNEERLARRLLPLHLETEETLTVAMVAELFEAQEDLSASTKNKLRGVGRLIVDFATASQRWLRPNPFALVKREKEGRRRYELLTLEELYRLQPHLPPHRLRLFRCALHLGMRPGELMGLRVEDVDFVNNLIHVRRSRDRSETKTGTERTIPLLPAVHLDLLDACTDAKGELVFGHVADGSMESQNTKLTRILRTAMVKADVGVLGADYKCRRAGCGHTETRLGPVDRRRKMRCPRCDMRLWAVPMVRPVRWYDLRHMCATFHHDAGADDLCISLALGHSLSDETTTKKTYVHPSAAKMAAELGRWSLRRPRQAEQLLTCELNTR